MHKLFLCCNGLLPIFRLAVCSLLLHVGAGGGALAGTQLVRLPDGRALELAEYGDPDGPLVLYFHGTPGTHLEPLAVLREIQRSGIHVVAVNRPGIGRSTYQPGRRIVDWPADVACLLAALGYDDRQFGVIGFSGGAPYALVCALAMPERISRVAIVSGHTSLCLPGVEQGVEDRNIALMRSHPRLGKIGIEFINRTLQSHPNKAIKRFTQNWSSTDRNLIYGNGAMKHLLKRSLQHATLCGNAGILRDVQLLGGCWGLDLQQIHGMPITIWHGGCDRIATVSMAHYFQAQLAESTLTLDAGSGHITTFTRHGDEILGEFHESGLIIPAPNE
jgi:pimeloyl-ACP methyl ester carboxylesterase